MATILFYGTHGPDEATRAVMPWHMAKGALEAGHTVKIALVGDASFLMKDSIAREGQRRGRAKRGRDHRGARGQGRRDHGLRGMRPRPWGDGRRFEGQECNLGQPEDVRRIGGRRR